MVSRADEGKELNIVPVSQISNGGFSEGNKGGDWKTKTFLWVWLKYKFRKEKKHTIILKAEWIFKPGKDSKRFIKWFDFGSGKGNMLELLAHKN